MKRGSKMTYQEKLIMFMKMKNKIIKEKLKINFDYFTKDDEKEIKKWPDGIVENIWLHIKYAVLLGYESLITDLCPFCLYPGKCDRCPYAQHHKERGSPDSDFIKIVRVAKEKGIYLNQILSNRIYKEILNEIEKKETK